MCNTTRFEPPSLALLTRVREEAIDLEQATARLQNPIEFLAYPTLRPVARYNGHSGGVLHAEISGDGKTLITGGQEETIKVWDMPEYHLKPAGSARWEGTLAPRGRKGVLSCATIR